MYPARREPQGLMTGSNDQFKKKTEQSGSTLRNSTRLPSTGSGPEHVEGSRSTLSHLTLSRSTLSRSTLSSRPKGSLQAAVYRSGLQRDSLVLKSIKRSVINIGRSMLDVRCSMFISFSRLNWPLFRPAAGLNPEP